MTRRGGLHGSRVRAAAIASSLGLACALASPHALAAEPDAPPAPAANPNAPRESGEPGASDHAGNDSADETTEAARKHFAAGVNLLQDPDKPRYEEAYAEFKRAYELAKSPKILGNLGLCAMMLERDAEAIDAYKRYLSEVHDLDPAERTQAERDLSTLSAGIATITVESEPEGALLSDTRIPVRGQPVSNSYGAMHGKVVLGIRRGHHILKARFADGKESTWVVDVRGGEAHRFDAPRTPRSPTVVLGPPVQQRTIVTRPVPRSVYATAIGTGVLTLAAVGTGTFALVQHSRFQDANDATNPDRADSLRSTGKTLNVVADVCVGAAILGAAVTTYLYLTRPTQREVVTASAPAPGVASSLTIAPSGISARF